jgi:hypothetical protein
LIGELPEKLRQAHTPTLEPIAVLQLEKRILTVIFGGASINECKDGRRVIDNDRLYFGTARKPRFTVIGRLPRGTSVTGTIEALMRTEEERRSSISFKAPDASDIVILEKLECNSLPLL